MLDDFRKTIEIIKYDFYRNSGSNSKKMFIKNILDKGSPTGFLIYFRLSKYLKYSRMGKCLYYLIYYGYKKREIACGYDINIETNIGKGLRLPHRGNIVIHYKAIIGENCEIMQGVTIG
ncbi:MAG: LbetaH domain-containing protein, partial [Mobilitalea sp.]